MPNLLYILGAKMQKKRAVQICVVEVILEKKKSLSADIFYTTCTFYNVFLLTVVFMA